MTRYCWWSISRAASSTTPMEEWKPEEITAHLDYYRALHKELVEQR